MYECMGKLIKCVNKKIVQIGNCLSVLFANCHLILEDQRRDRKKDEENINMEFKMANTIYFHPYIYMYVSRWKLYQYQIFFRPVKLYTIEHHPKILLVKC
jgi:hypothetical protein